MHPVGAVQVKPSSTGVGRPPKRPDPGYANLTSSKARVVRGRTAAPPPNLWQRRPEDISPLLVDADEAAIRSYWKARTPETLTASQGVALPPGLKLTPAVCLPLGDFDARAYLGDRSSEQSSKVIFRSVTW